MADQFVLGQALTEMSTTRRMALGTRVTAVESTKGKNYVNEYVYVVSGVAIATGVFCQYNGDTSYEVIEGTDGVLAATFGIKGSGAGISMVATTAADQFFWCLRRGVWAQSALAPGAPNGLVAAATTGILSAAALASGAQNVGYITADNVAILNIEAAGVI